GRLALPLGRLIASSGRPHRDECAELAVAALAGSEHAATPTEFRRLLTPDDVDRGAAALLRHPDLLWPVAELHHDQLVDRLAPGETLAA
ncbi:hypothetical protein ACWDE9_39705, partial [Streptomyces olivaceoviridis]